jgi:UrcA family protein
MPISLSPKRLALASLTAIGLAAGVAMTPARALPGDDEAAGDGQVTVYAPRAERDPASGAEINTVSASRAVFYGDLDLSAPWGMRALHARLERAAAAACNQLLNDPTLVIINSEGDCIAPAVRDAMYRVGMPDAYGD